MPKRNHQDYLNMIRSEAQSHYRTQKSIGKAKKRRLPAANAFAIFMSVNVWGWLYHYLKSRVGKKHPFVDYTTALSNGVYRMEARGNGVDRGGAGRLAARAGAGTRGAGDAESGVSGDAEVIKIVLAADWATHTDESDHIGRLMKKEDPDYSIHLGDTYFVGAPDEIASNFTDPGNSWPRGHAGSLALPGNHEFYSNGNPYFDKLLPHMFIRSGDKFLPQEASFFCLENDHWKLIGLDNGYYSVGRYILEFIFQPDTRLDDKLINWLKTEVAKDPGDKRGLVFFSHIQYCSAFEKGFPRTAEALEQVFPGRKAIWIWGHEHRLAVYGRHKSKKGIEAYGRCIGHGGMPVEIGKVKGGQEIFKGPQPKKRESCELVFFDNRKKQIVDHTILGHNGYALMTLAGNKLKIEYKDETTWLFAEEWEVKEGEMKGKAWSNPAVALNRVAASYDVAVAP